MSRAGPGFFPSLATQPGNPGSAQGSGFESFPGRVPGFEIFCPVFGPGPGFHFKIFRAHPWLTPLNREDPSFEIFVSFEI